MYKLSQRSWDNLMTCHPDLQKIGALAITLSPVDFIITEGHRSIERQTELFNKGLSKIDGISKKGKHNYDPSMALDFCAYVKGKEKLMWDKVHLTAIATAFHCAAEMLYAEGEITHKIRWGANWDRDGELLYDHTFQDMPHVELIKI